VSVGHDALGCIRSRYPRRSSVILTLHSHLPITFLALCIFLLQCLELYTTDVYCPVRVNPKLPTSTLLWQSAASAHRADGIILLRSYFALSCSLVCVGSVIGLSLRCYCTPMSGATPLGPFLLHSPPRSAPASIYPTPRAISISAQSRGLAINRVLVLTDRLPRALRPLPTCTYIYPPSRCFIEFSVVQLHAIIFQEDLILQVHLVG
jgi:hypothetical protein